VYSRFTKTLVALTAVGALAVPTVAQARHGSDDPATHVRHEHHGVRHDAARHHDRPDRDRRGDRDNDRGDDHGGR